MSAKTNYFLMPNRIRFNDWQKVLYPSGCSSVSHMPFLRLPPMQLFEPNTYLWPMKPIQTTITIYTKKGTIHYTIIIYKFTDLDKKTHTAGCILN